MAANPAHGEAGRVHTSTVTVAVLDEPSEREVVILPQDVEETFTRGSGPGGQHRNKTDTTVVLRHIPTGVVVRVDGGRSQYQNRQTALGVLRARLREAQTLAATTERNATRKGQVGVGARGDKVRTIALQRDQVSDHQTGRTITAQRYLRGHLRDLW